MSVISSALGLSGEQVRHVLGATRPPQVVLRIGHGWPVPATPRRATAELLAPAVVAEGSRA